MGRKKKSAGIAVPFRRTHETEKEGFAREKGIGFPTLLPLAAGKQRLLNRPGSVANPTTTAIPPVLRGRDGPEGRQLRGELRGPKKVLFFSEDWRFRLLPRGVVGSRDNQASVRENLDPLEPKQYTRVGLKKTFSIAWICPDIERCLASDVEWHLLAQTWQLNSKWMGKNLDNTKLIY